MAKNSKQCTPQNDQSEREIDALTKAVAVIRAGTTKITPEGIKALNAAKTVVHDAVASLEATAKQFPDASDKDMLTRYQKIEAVLTHAVKTGKIDAPKEEVLKAIKTFTADHQDQKLTLGANCLSVADSLSRY